MSAPCSVARRNGTGPVVLVCEHASHAVPYHFEDALAPRDVLISHWGWDPGALEIANHLSRAFDAPLVSATYSRLVYDLNRPPASPDAMRERIENQSVPGNSDLKDAERNWRTTHIYEPFHAEVEALLESRQHSGQASVLVTVHTFTPVYFGRRRDVEIGILHDSDTRLADAMLASPGPRNTKRNEPYRPEDGVMHTLTRHAIPRNLLNVMIEVRSDLVQSAEQQEAVADELAGVLRNALNSLGVDLDVAACGVPA